MCVCECVNLCVGVCVCLNLCVGVRVCVWGMGATSETVIIPSSTSSSQAHGKRGELGGQWGAQKVCTATQKGLLSNLPNCKN